MWFLPLLIIGAIVVAAASRSPREASSQQLAIAGAPPPPGPISVLGEFVRIGHVPPPTVILCAIAEAEAIGRDDVATDIIRVFVAPVVYQQELASARFAQPSGRGERRASSFSCSPREALYAPGRGGSVQQVPVPAGPSTQLWPPEANYPGMDTHFAAMARAKHGELAARKSPSPDVRAAATAAAQFPTDEEIRAMLNANPEQFVAMATRGMPVIEVPIEAVHQATVHAVMPSRPAEAPAASNAPTVQPTGLPPEMVAQMQEAAGLHEAADFTRAMAPGSPLVGVSDDAWRTFVTRLERESPLFSSSRHVGQYRHRRERLAELGVDPNALLGSAQAQRAALDADLVDAHHHAAEGGLLGEHVGRPVVIPGRDGTETITTSGVLGVIQCAGLENAVGWLERSNDRKRYPYTTQVFQRTNGVF